MTPKEKEIVKQLGYSAFVIYLYIKTHRIFTNRQMERELGMCERARHRNMKKLVECNIIEDDGEKYPRERLIDIIKESEWKI